MIHWPGRPVGSRHSLSRNKQSGRFVRQTPWVTVSLLLLAACSPREDTSTPDGDSRLDGAWRLSTAEVITPDGRRIPGQAHESFLLISSPFYSMNWAGGASPAPHSATHLQPTDTEKIARYGTVIVNAGRIDARDGRMTIHPDFALVPEYVGGLGVFDYALRGDTLDLEWHTIQSVDGTADPSTGIGVRFRYQWVRR